MDAKLIPNAVYNIVLEQDNILLVKKNNLWKLPGGVITPGKHPLDQIFLHINSELPSLKSLVSGDLFGIITNISDLKAYVYFIKLDSGSIQAIQAGPQVEGAGWFRDTKDLNLEPVTEGVIKLLRQLGRIK